MPTLSTNALAAAVVVARQEQTSKDSRPNFTPDGAPIFYVTVGHIITILGVVLFGAGLGFVIWWYWRPAAVAARNKRRGVA
jgi:hypothetical protein